MRFSALFLLTLICLVCCGCKSDEQRFAEIRCAEIHRAREKGCPMQCTAGRLSTDFLCEDMISTQIGQCLMGEINDRLSSPTSLFSLPPDMDDCEVPLAEEFGMKPSTFGKVSDSFMLRCRQGDTEACDIACCHEAACQSSFVEHLPKIISALSGAANPTMNDTADLADIVPAPLFDDAQRILDKMNIALPEMYLIIDAETANGRQQIYSSGNFGDCSGTRLLSVMVSFIEADDSSTALIMNLNPSPHEAFGGMRGFPFPGINQSLKDLGTAVVANASGTTLTYLYTDNNDKECVLAETLPINLATVYLQSCINAVDTMNLARAITQYLMVDQICGAFAERIGEAISLPFASAGTRLGTNAAHLLNVGETTKFTLQAGGFLAGETAGFIAGGIPAKLGCDDILNAIIDEHTPAELKAMKISDEFCKRALNKQIKNFYCPDNSRIGSDDAK